MANAANAYFYLFYSILQNKYHYFTNILEFPFKQDIIIIIIVSSKFDLSRS